MVSRLNYGEKGEGQNVTSYDRMADCIRSGYVGGQLVITRNILTL